MTCPIGGAPNHARLDEICRHNTAFASFAELVGSHPGYRPSLDQRQAWARELADAYDAAQVEAGDPRRAYRYGSVDPAQRGMLPGDRARILVNQGKREAECLAILGDRALIVYHMPAGGSHLLEVSAERPLRKALDWPRPAGHQVTNITRNRQRTPKRWRQVVLDHGLEEG